MTIRRATLGLALVVGLLGMHGLATGHMTMTASPMPSAHTMPRMTAPVGSHRGPSASVADEVMHHDVCVAVQRDAPGVPAAPASSPLPFSAGTATGEIAVPVARTGRAPPGPSPERLCISRT